MFLLTDDAWEVKKTEKKGRGLFAKKEIIPGTVIGDYLGRVLRTAEEDTIDESENFYLMYYHDYASIFPDLTKPGIHLLNHSCSPNCWMYTYKGHTLFFAIRRIFPGEELTVNYLLSPLDKYCSPCTHLCQCGSVICYQTMHLPKKLYDLWNTFHDKESAKTKKERIQYGKDLPQLSSYPDTIPDHPVYTLFGAANCEPAQLSNTTLPSRTELRALVRETGRRLDFPSINTRVLGITDTLVLTEPLG